MPVVAQPTPLAHRVAPRGRLDLDHIHPEVAEQRPHVGPGQQLTELDRDESLQRPAGEHRSSGLGAAGIAGWLLGVGYWLHSVSSQRAPEAPRFRRRDRIPQHTASPSTRLYADLCSRAAVLKTVLAPEGRPRDGAAG